MRRLLIIIAMLCIYAGSIQAGTKVDRPKLVVGLMVDQMRWDYLYYYYSDYEEGGLKRLLAEGFSCENTMIPYIPTITAIGHTSVYTGSTPALHGICGNDFFIDGKAVYCCGDSTVRSVGSNSKKGQMSPRNMIATTIGDELKIATNWKSKVIGVALKDRAAILPAGHSADAAYWWDTTVGHYITSTYYMDKLPKWVEEFNKENHTASNFDIRDTDQGVTMTFKMAEAVLDNEHLGQRGETDMLAVSVSSTDIIGHRVGTRGPENKSVYLQLDRDIAKFLKKLDEQVGKGNYLLFLTADHGAAHNYNYLNEHKIPGGGLESWKHVKTLNQHLSEKHPGAGDLILGSHSLRYYLNYENIEKAGLDPQKVKQEAIAWLKKDRRFLQVIDFEQAATAPLPKTIRERICNGYHYGRSGDIYAIARSQYTDTEDSPTYKGTTHGNWNPYDSHIPAVFFGWHVKHGSTSKPTYMTDIAPTICELLHTEMPSSCIGNAIEDIVE